MLDDGCLCRLCGGAFFPEERGQLYCSEFCENHDRLIDEAEARREEDCERLGIPKSQSPR